METRSVEEPRVRLILSPGWTDEERSIIWVKLELETVVE